MSAIPTTGPATVKVGGSTYDAQRLEIRDGLLILEGRLHKRPDAPLVRRAFATHAVSVVRWEAGR